jgi:hypothetical protein
MTWSNQKNRVATDERLDQLAAALIEAGGNPVNGGTLAQLVGITKEQLTNVMGTLAHRRPDLQIETFRPHGYRAAALGPITMELGTAHRAKPRPMPAERHYQRFRRGMDLVSLLDQGDAEQVAMIALECEELFAATVHRLLSYGIKEHRARVLAGEHPLQLRSAA